MPDRPNILLIMTDQQRWDSLGCYGCEASNTPNLDRLAGEGALFERCYVNNPICTPSRASMFTGKHIQGHGVFDLYGNLADEEVLFPEHLQRAGYRTALFGKMHVRSRTVENHIRHPHDGFDEYEWCLEHAIELDSPLNGYSAWLREKDPKYWAELREQGRMLLHVPHEYHMTHWAAERTIDYIRRQDGSQPFLAMMSIFDPHNPYEHWPEEMAESIDESKVEDPLIIDGEMDTLPRGVRQEHEESYLGPFSQYSREDLRKMRFGYHAALALADIEIGRVLDTLREKGFEEDTLVIFCSDHGDMLGDHSLLVKGGFFFEANVRVPLIARWPARFAGGRSVDSLVQLHDIAATVLAAAGLSGDDVRAHAPDAESLLPLATGERDRVRDWATCSYRNTGIRLGAVSFDPPIHATMFMDERYKLGVYHAVRGVSGTEGVLYDMVDDPNETRNLWDDPEYQTIRMNLTQRMLDWEIGQELEWGPRGGVDEPEAAGRILKDPTRDR